MLRVKLVLLAGLLLALAGGLHGQDKGDGPPLAGTWKIILPTLEAAQGRPVALIKLEKNKAGKWQGELIDSKLSEGKTEVEAISATDKVGKFTLKTSGQSLTCVVNLPKDAKGGKLFGEATLRRDAIAMEMARTSMTSLDLFELDREELANEPLGMRAVVLARGLLSAAEKNKIKPDEVRRWADKAVKSAQLYGPGLTRETLLNVARILTQQKGHEKTALQYAERAEAGLDEKSEGSSATKVILDVLMDAQEKAGSKADAAKTLARIKKLDFKIRPIKVARKGKSDRVVLAELFTGSQAKSCVAAGMAMEALAKTFKPTELTVIAYHQHFGGKGPEGDPLGSPESEDRLKFYAENVPSLPTMLLNGKVGVRGGGGQEDAQENYERYANAIESMLDTESKAQLDLKATRKGNTVTITADISKLEETGDDVRLRVVLVEQEATYKGASGATVHYNVARAMPGGHDGTVLKTKATKKTFTVDVAELKKKLTKYQEDVDKKRAFPDKERPLDLKTLRVIAFIQNDANNEILQAAQTDVTGE